MFITLCRPQRGDVFSSSEHWILASTRWNSLGIEPWSRFGECVLLQPALRSPSLPLPRQNGEHKCPLPSESILYGSQDTNEDWPYNSASIFSCFLPLSECCKFRLFKATAPLSSHCSLWTSACDAFTIKTYKDNVTVLPLLRRGSHGPRPPLPRRPDVGEWPSGN